MNKYVEAALENYVNDYMLDKQKKLVQDEETEETEE